MISAERKKWLAERLRGMANQGSPATEWRAIALSFRELASRSMRSRSEMRQRNRAVIGAKDHSSVLTRARKPELNLAQAEELVGFDCGSSMTQKTKWLGQARP